MKTKVVEEILDTKIETGKVYEDKTLNFETKELVIKGKDISLRIPGARVYSNIERIEIEYDKPMKIELTGRVIELPRKIVEVKDLTVLIESEKVNEVEEKFYDKNQAIYYTTPKPKYRDPEIKIYNSNGCIVLNQVHGIPKIRLSNGFVRYK